MLDIRQFDRLSLSVDIKDSVLLDEKIQIGYKFIEVPENLYAVDHFGRVHLIGNNSTVALGKNGGYRIKQYDGLSFECAYLAKFIEK